jgi:hypothetical protein
MKRVIVIGCVAKITNSDQSLSSNRKYKIQKWGNADPSQKCALARVEITEICGPHLLAVCNMRTFEHSTM